jgi:hypothetical protein
MDPAIQSLIDYGIARSATFRSLIATLADTDVIVYVESKILPNGLIGSTSHRIVLGGAHRFVRLSISPHGTDKRRTMVIAHELQHAIEIAHASEVGRSQSADQMLARIGFPVACGRPGCFETMAAIAVENRVQDELSAAD